MSAGRILIVDDDPQIRRIMRTTLTSAGYEVDDARTGESALEKVRGFRPDLVLLDMNMPGMGGLAACKAIRADSTIAIIMLTVRNAEADKVAALDSGADDFVTKPFSTPELMARIRAAMRRIPASSQSLTAKLRIGQLTIDFGARTVNNGTASNHLTPKELDLLRYLTQRANEAVPHRELLQAVWGPDYGDQVDYLRVFIKTLRKKLELNPEHPEFITTEPWIGYRFNGVPESVESS
ncbi:MAG: response regulator transcription factor [Bryobacteraceae bacterium]|nr:response regulator transcription factor [Bryobacteraceae bacterium]